MLVKTYHLPYVGKTIVLCELCSQDDGVISCVGSIGHVVDDEHAGKCDACGPLYEKEQIS